LAAAYEGQETHHLIEKATAVLFEFGNQLVQDGGIYLEDGHFVPIDVMFVSDLKMMPYVLGVKHSSSNEFCPMCTVSRAAHKEKASIGEPHNVLAPTSKALLRIPIEDVVCPPLHMLQGATNLVLKKMVREKKKTKEKDKEREKELAE
jgi:hypothetical protein